MDHNDGAQKAYEPPAIAVIGTIHGLTQAYDKTFGWSDGFLFLDDRVTNTSR